MDELTQAMQGGMQVDPNSMGGHPRYSLFKNTTKAAEAQAQRRADALERQRNARIDHHNKMRRLVEDGPWEDEEDYDIEDTNYGTSNEFSSQDTEMSVDPADTASRTSRNPYAHQLMTSEWLVDIPDKENFAQEWIMMACPTGRRGLLVASKGTTTIYSKHGKLVDQFVSALPGGRGKKNNAYTILDCIIAEDKTIYCLDLLCWNGTTYTDNDFAFRQFFLKSRLEELPNSRNQRRKFDVLPTCPCDIPTMENFMRQTFPFSLDGLLFYYSQSHYIAGQSPLVGWLKPFMLTDVLSVSVPASYMFLAEGKSTTDFINDFNKKHDFKSKIDITE